MRDLTGLWLGPDGGLGADVGTGSVLVLTPLETAWSGVALDPGSSKDWAWVNLAFAKLFERADLFFLHLGIIQNIWIRSNTLSRGEK